MINTDCFSIIKMPAHKTEPSSRRASNEPERCQPEGNSIFATWTMWTNPQIHRVQLRSVYKCFRSLEGIRHPCGHSNVANIQETTGWNPKPVIDKTSGEYTWKQSVTHKARKAKTEALWETADIRVASRRGKMGNRWAGGGGGGGWGCQVMAMMGERGNCRAVWSDWIRPDKRQTVLCIKQCSVLSILCCRRVMLPLPVSPVYCLHSCIYCKTNKLCAYL